MLHSIIPFFRKRVEALLASPSIEEWKIRILSKVRSEASNLFQNSELFAYNTFYWLQSKGLGWLQVQHFQGDGRLEIPNAPPSWWGGKGSLHRKVAQPPHLPKIFRSGTFCALSQRSRTMCELLLKAEESWRLNALSEAANAGFWLAHLVSRYLCYRLISYKMNSLFIFLPWGVNMNGRVDFFW